MPGILIIQTAFLGDVILTTPLIAATDLRFHPDRVTALVIPSGGQALGHPDSLIDGLDETIVYDKRGADKGFGKFLDLAKKLKERRFDVALVPHRSARSAALAYLAGIPKRVGFTENALGFLFTDRVPRIKTKHDVERNLDLLIPFGGAPDGFVAELKVSHGKAAQARADELLAGIDRNAPLIGMAPGSVWGTKRWPPEKFAAVADSLSKEFGAKIVLVGGPDDLPPASGVVGKSNVEILDLVGKTNIREMMAVVGKTSLFVTNDTGPMHVAVALKVPVVAVFGSTTPALGFSPYTKLARIVETRSYLDCRPCGAHGPKSCPMGHFKCMKEIDPEWVVDAAREFLKNK